MGAPYRLLASLLAALATPAASGERYVGVYLGSQHIGSDAFNDVNPGLTLGRRWSLGPRGVEAHLEGGVFVNSYSEVSPIVVGGVSARLAELGPGELRVGASLGAAYYRELSDVLDDRYGFRLAGPFVPIAALSVAWRAGGVETRLSALPPSEEVSTVLNLSFAVEF